MANFDLSNLALQGVCPGNEILLDDAVSLGQALEAAGCRARLTVAEDMWHAYLFYNLRRHRTQMREAAEFVREKLT